MKEGQTHYDVLEVARAASDGVIRAAYRSLSQKHHPDVSTGPDSSGRMGAINAAYAVLSNPVRRAAYDRSLGSSATSRPGAGQVPATGWGRRAGGRWERFVRGWVEYAIDNDTADHAWVGLADERGNPLRTVFIRSGERASVIVTARPAHMTVALGRTWDHERQGFAPEHRLWRTTSPIRPPGPRMRLDIGLSSFARLGRFETLEPRVDPAPLPFVSGKSATGGVSGVFLAATAVCMLSLSLWGAFVLRAQWALLAAGILGLSCATALSHRWARSGHRRRAAVVACLAGSALWASAGWRVVSGLLQSNGWNWSPTPIHGWCWLVAALGPSAWGWSAWVSRDPAAPRAAWGGLTLFCGLALAAMWGGVFGWDGASWKVLLGGPVPSPSLWAAATCLVVAWSSLAWSAVLLMERVITGLGDRAFNPWASAYWRLLTAWALLPVIVVAALPNLSVSWWRGYLTWFIRALP